MNKTTLILTLCLGIFAFAARADYRDFTDSKGREINAKLIRYDATKKKVTIQRKGKGSATVPISLFSEDDQKYIISWNKNQDFLSDKLLKVKFTRWKTKNTERSRSSSWWEQKYSDCSFSIELENRSTTDFKEITLEYVIFYSQDHHIRDFSDKEERHGTLYSKNLISLPKKSKKMVETKKICLCREKIGANSYGRPDLEREMHGIMLKLSIKSETGETISRKITFPDKLSKVWTPRTKEAQILPN